MTMGKAKIYWLQKKTTVPQKLPTKGKVSIRPVSFRNDRIIDKYVVTGGSCKPVITGSRGSALTVAEARLRVLEKHRKRKRKR